MRNAHLLGSAACVLLLACEPVKAPITDGGGGDGNSDIDAPVVACGNDDVETGETCDDGNTESGDGCSSVCLDETAVCIPTILTPSYPTGQGGRMVVDGDILYMAGHRGIQQPTMRLLDVADPTNISQVGSFQLSEYPVGRTHGIVKRDNLIVLAGQEPGLVVVNVANPEAPVEGGVLLNPPSDGHLALLPDGRLLVAQSDGETPTIYTFTSSAFTSIGSIGNSGTVYYNVGASETYTFASTSNGQIDIMGPDGSAVGFARVGTYVHSDPWNAGLAVQKIVARGDLMVFSVKGMASGTYIIDVGIPSAPTLVASLAENSADLLLHGDYLYLPIADGLRVYDISTPSTPVLAGSVIETAVGAESVATDGTHMFIGGESKLLTAVGLPGMCDAQCGNSQREYPEACDDGNREDGDGCSADCN